MSWENPSVRAVGALYWITEKLTWGYENVEPTRPKFLDSSGSGRHRLLRCADQDRPAATTRQRYARPERGPQSYLAAAKTRNFVALAFLAQLLSQSSHLERAETGGPCS